MERKISPDINGEAFVEEQSNVLDKSVFSFGAPQASGSDVTFEAPLPDLRKGLRFVSIGVQAGKLLGNFVETVFGAVEIYPVTPENVRGFSTQLGDYSVTVVLATDVQRAKRMMREVRAITQNKLCYAILEQSTPQSRAALMRQYFDDVFDLRTEPREIHARIGSHYDRQQRFNTSAEDEAIFTAFCKENLSDPIHYLQAPLLKHLYDNMGEVVRYRELAAYDFHSGEFRVESLKVRIHNLRRKLRNYDIRCKRSVGYALVKLDD